MHPFGAFLPMNFAVISSCTWYFACICTAMRASYYTHPLNRWRRDFSSAHLLLTTSSHLNHHPSHLSATHGPCRGADGGEHRHAAVLQLALSAAAEGVHVAVLREAHGVEVAQGRLRSVGGVVGAGGAGKRWKVVGLKEEKDMRRTMGHSTVLAETLGPMLENLEGEFHFHHLG